MDGHESLAYTNVCPRARVADSMYAGGSGAGWSVSIPFFAPVYHRGAQPSLNL